MYIYIYRYIYIYFPLKHRVLYIYKTRCFRKYGFLMLLQLATIVFTIRPYKFKDTVAAVNLTFNTPPTTHWNQFHRFHGSSRQQYVYGHHSLFYRTYCIFRRIYVINNSCNFNLIYRYSLSVRKFNSIYYSVTVTRCCSYSCFVLLKMGDSDARNM